MHKCEMMNAFIFDNDEDYYNPDLLVRYVEKNNDYGLPYRSGKDYVKYVKKIDEYGERYSHKKLKMVQIIYCPWCGTELKMLDS